MDSARRRLAFRIAAVALALLALEGVSWVALRVLDGRSGLDRGPEWLVHAMSAMESGFYRPDPHALWTLTPKYREEPTGDGIWGADTLQLNAFGHRSPSMSREKPEGVRRVLVLGGSHPFGMWVGMQEVYSAVLERRLNEASDGVWQVLNAASPGHTTYQGARYLAHRGLAFEPDVVIFDLGVNDNLPLALDYAAPDHEVGAVPLWARVTSKGAGSLQTYRLLKELLASSVGQPRVEGVRVPPDRRRENLAAVRDLAEEHGFDVLFVSQVTVDGFRGPGRVRCVYDPVRDGFTPVLDVCGVFDALGADAGREFVDPVHADAAGHARIGEAAFLRMRELGWVEGSPSRR